MISHVTYITYIALTYTALLSTHAVPHAALQLNQPQSPCSCAAEIFHFFLVSTQTPEIPFSVSLVR